MSLWARPTMKIILLVLAGIAGIVGLFLLVMQFGGISTERYNSMTGEEMYARLCAHCHGPDGGGKTGATYRGKREFWNEAELLEYLKHPAAYQRKNPRLQGRFMPPLDSSMPLEARKRLVAHVLGMMDNLKNP